MSNICSTCSLPEDLCVCETIAKESQKVTVTTERRKFGRRYTVIKGIDSGDISLEDLTKVLKSKLACGGAIKGKQIELQGNHVKKVKEILIDQGFPAETISIER